MAFLKACVPSGVKTALKETARKRRFSQAFKAYRAISRTRKPSHGEIVELISAWGNEGYSAEHELLIELVELGRRLDGPVMECGSGLSTLLVGLEAQRRNQKVYSLEHHPGWAARMVGELKSAGLTNVEILQAPLRSYGAYSWYDVPLDRLPARFALAICDGPPGDTPGGRVGMLPALRNRLTPGSIVLLDDYEREAEQALAARWITETGASMAIGGVEKPVPVLTMV
jgi:predicted O-methyltransferase YrrM